MLARNPIRGMNDYRMRESVECYMKGKKLVFPTRRQAMDAMLEGALISESRSEDEYMYSNIMLQLMHGFRLCYDRKRLI